MSDRLVLDFRRASGFDRDWYIRTYGNLSGLADSVDAALVHFIGEGNDAGWRPNADFDSDWYVEKHPDLRQALASGVPHSPYLHYLHSIERGIPHLPSPTTAIIGVNLRDGSAVSIEAVARMTCRALGWRFMILAPPGVLPHGEFGPNTTIHAKVDQIGQVDLWLTLGVTVDLPKLSFPAVRSFELGALLMSVSGSPTLPTDDHLDRALEVLRSSMVRELAVVPGARSDNGPVHVDLARVPALMVTVQTGSAGWQGGGVILRSQSGDLAEFPPSRDAIIQAPVPLCGYDGLSVTMSPGSVVSFNTCKINNRPVDIMLVSNRKQCAYLWQRSMEQAGQVYGLGRLILVNPPNSMDVLDGVEVAAGIEDGLRASESWVLIVPVGITLFRQSLGQMLHYIRRYGIARRSVVFPAAIRHPSGHLVSWRPSNESDGTETERIWRDSTMVALTPKARRGAAAIGGYENNGDSPRHDAPCLGALDPGLWRVGARRHPEIAPPWLRLTAHRDGAVVGELVLTGGPIGDGGRIVLIGNARAALAEPCEMVAVEVSRTAGHLELSRMCIPISGRFIWPINLPGPSGGARSIAIQPPGPYSTAQDSPDPRPVIFWIEAITYTNL
ncbi:hypothetical protein N9F34_05690 [Alphaproteobacteria bacterium]|nr:hypothetical protein [Alphaproteobacteria bacterium]